MFKKFIDSNNTKELKVKYFGQNKKGDTSNKIILLEFRKRSNLGDSRGI